MLIDTHSHINSEKLKDELPSILDNLNTGVVGRVICPSYSLDSSQSSLKLALSNDKVFCALGIHPENASEWNDEVKFFIKENCINSKNVAIGEIGLDYHYNTDNKEMQFKCLNEQIEIASKYDLPVIFHVRDAFEDFFEWLKTNRQKFKKGVVHCFEGNAEIAQKILDYDLNISFTGLITFKPRQDIREAVAVVPIQKIMVETDAPYLAPEPFRGKINRPEYTEFVARKIAEIKNIEFEEVENITTQNAYNFFDKMREFDDRK